METLLTVLLFIFAGFWLFGKLSKWLLQSWIIKKQRQFSGQFGGSFGGQPFGGQRPSGGGAQTRPEGEVVITHKEVETDYRVNRSTGEYVQYEEISESDDTQK